MKEVNDEQKVEDKNIRWRTSRGEVSVPLLPRFPLLPQLPSLPLLSFLFLSTLTWPTKSWAQASPASTAAPLSHDLSGVWMQYPDGDIVGTPGMNGVNEHFRPPLTPWGQAQVNAAKPLSGSKAVAGTEDTSILRCEPSGPPQILIMPNPWEIVQIPGRILMFFEQQHIWREIWMDGRALPKDPDPSWLGYSVGHWEGDTLVVETVGFNDKEWVDLYGNPRTSTTHLTERYRRLNHDTLEQQIIIEDPRVYTKPWVSPPKLHKLEPGWEIAEWFCVLDENKDYDSVVRKPAGVAPPSK
jgi:hypothetical protein